MRLKHFFFGNTYRKEMTLIFVVKLIALILLWQLFFSHHQKESRPIEPIAIHFTQ